MSKEITKTIKIEIVIDEAKWNDIFVDLTNCTSRLMNKTISIGWEYSNMSSEYNFKSKELKEKMKAISGSQGVGNLAYKILVSDGEENSSLYSNNAAQSIKLAGDKWEEVAREIEEGNARIPNYKHNVPIDIAKGNIELRYDEDLDAYYFNLKLLKPKYAESIGVKSTSLLFKVIKLDRARECILQRLDSGEYKFCSSKLECRKGKYMFILTYQLEQKKRELKSENILGVDMGVVNAAVLAVNNSLERAYISGKEVAEYKRRIESRKVDLKRQSAYCGDGRRGHGTKSKMKSLDALREKESNFRNTTNHKYAKFIVNKALKYECATIQIEDLKGIKGNNSDKLLKSWTYFDLQKKIEDKAKEYGIKVVKISPEFTSQRCGKCGYINKKNREVQEKFICINCGYKANADYNAAANIAIKNIDNKIRIQRMIQEKYGEEYLILFKGKQCNNIPLIKVVEKLFKLHYEKKKAENKGENTKEIVSSIDECKKEIDKMIERKISNE